MTDKKYDMCYFNNENDVVTLSNSKVCNQYKNKIAILDMIFTNHKNKKQYYIAYFPNINETNFDIAIAGPKVDLNSFYLGIKVKHNNMIFCNSPWIVEMDYGSSELPEILINQKKVSFDRRDVYLYLQAQVIRNSSVYYADVSQSYQYSSGNDYSMKLIRTNFEYNYSIKQSKKTNSIYIRNVYLENIVVKSQWILKLEYYTVIFLSEVYYKLKLYKVKKTLENSVFVNQLSDKVEEIPKYLSREELINTLKKGK